jgi:hypothetical protein
MLRFYERTLDIALRFRFVTLMVFVATVTVTGVLYEYIPKGFFRPRTLASSSASPMWRKMYPTTKCRRCRRR